MTAGNATYSLRLIVMRLVTSDISRSGPYWMWHQSSRGQYIPGTVVETEEQAAEQATFQSAKANATINRAKKLRISDR